MSVVMWGFRCFRLSEISSNEVRFLWKFHRTEGFSLTRGDLRNDSFNYLYAGLD